MRFSSEGLEFEVSIKITGLEALKFRVKDMGLRVSHLGFMVKAVGFKVFEFRAFKL